MATKLSNQPGAQPRGPIRFHVMRDGLRTTITLDSKIAEFLALRLDPTEPPQSAKSRTKIRKWLQSQVDTATGQLAGGLSKWLEEQALLEIVDRELVIASMIA